VWCGYFLAVSLLVSEEGVVVAFGVSLSLLGGVWSLSSLRPPGIAVEDFDR
jgi:hypothetical protein